MEKHVSLEVAMVICFDNSLREAGIGRVAH